jgi:antitoxin component YwqK of YwqJK toxin-antitoxin module
MTIPARSLGRRVLLRLGVPVSAVCGLYLALYALNLLLPIVPELVTPPELYPLMFKLGLIGHTEKAYYDSGRLRYEKGWVPGQVNLLYGSLYNRFGQWQSFSPDGRVTCTVTFPGATGKWIEWHANGNMALETHYEDGKIHGTQKHWLEDGSRLWEEDFEHGVRNGRRLQWYPNGVLMDEAHFASGEADGKWTYWYPDGKKREERQYDADKKCGTWKSYGPNGELSAELEFPHANGRWVEWYENGVKALDGEYVDGREHGDWSTWGYDGKVEKITTYDHGSFVKSR